jgi:hypothetical protein
MDWKSLTSKLDPYIQKMNPYIEKAKDAGYKALDFTQKQLQNTPIVLKTLDEYNLLRTSKRFVLIAYDETDILSREVILRSPVWSTYAWSDAAEIRFLEISSAPDIVKNLGIVGPVDMHVWYLGAETAHLTNVEAIKSWWKSRNYDGSVGEIPLSQKNTETTVD